MNIGGITTLIFLATLLISSPILYWKIEKAPVASRKAPKKNIQEYYTTN